MDAGIADPQRLAIGGHCYGGYLTAWAISHSNRFKAAIAVACISNLTSHFGVGDIPTTDIDYSGGLPWQVPERYQRLSPLTHVEEIQTPFLLHHGEKDERVSLSQGREMYRALRYTDVPTDLLIYSNEGHVIGRPRGQIVSMQSSIGWLERWLNTPPDEKE